MTDNRRPAREGQRQRDEDRRQAERAARGGAVPHEDGQRGENKNARRDPQGQTHGPGEGHHAGSRDKQRS